MNEAKVPDLTRKSQKSPFAGRIIEELQTKRADTERHARDRVASDLWQGRLRKEIIYEELGILNRKGFKIKLAEEMERADRQNRKIQLLLFDADGLKKLNDKHGHLAGDNSLIILSTILKNSIRKYDHVGRWGGDEYFVILDDDNEQMPGNLSQRLRQGLSEKEEPYRSLRASIGVAAYDPRVEKLSTSQLFERADQAMYKAKQAKGDPDHPPVIWQPSMGTIAVEHRE